MKWQPLHIHTTAMHSRWLKSNSSMDEKSNRSRPASDGRESQTNTHFELFVAHLSKLCRGIQKRTVQEINRPRILTRIYLLFFIHFDSFMHICVYFRALVATRGFGRFHFCDSMSDVRFLNLGVFFRRFYLCGYAFFVCQSCVDAEAPFLRSRYRAAVLKHFTQMVFAMMTFFEYSSIEKVLNFK